MGLEDYTTEQAAALSGMTAASIRALARAGVVGSKAQQSPKNRAPWRYSFRDIRVLRSAAKLMGTGLKQVQRTFQALQSQVARRRLPLSGAHLVEDQGRLFARDGRSMWDTQSGQTLLWYEPRAASTTTLSEPQMPTAATVGANSLPNEGGTPRADEHFMAALALERDDPQGAYRAYLLALSCDPTHVEANINVGRICVVHRQLERAVGYFTVAALLDPAHGVAQFNLAVALHDLGRYQEAEVAYRHALVLDPDNQDAKVNLRLLLSDNGSL